MALRTCNTKEFSSMTVTNSNQEVPSGIFCFTPSLTISYLGAFGAEMSSLPNDSARPALFEQIKTFSRISTWLYIPVS